MPKIELLRLCDQVRVVRIDVLDEILHLKDTGDMFVYACLMVLDGNVNFGRVEPYHGRYWPNFIGMI